MADWLTHVLVGYVLATVLSAWWSWIEPRHVTLAMVGALVPDLSKAELLVPSDAVAALLGVPFDWFALHTVPSTVVVVAALALLLPARTRRGGFALLLLAGLSHHALDLLLVQSDGYTYAALWPVTDVRVPSADLYRSSDRLPALLASVTAFLVWTARTHVARAAPRPLPEETS